MSAATARATDGFSLIAEHDRHICIYGSANMAIVDELVRRGGLSEAARDEYAHGALSHLSVPKTMWGMPNGYIYNYEALGYSQDDVLGLGSIRSGGHTIYTRHGSITATSFGRGVIVVR
jgi:hypothetical protein